MRQVLDGNSADSTAAVAAWLAAGNEFKLPNLYLIGNPEDPGALWLTDWESPLVWPVWGDVAYQPARISRSSIESSIGLEVKQLSIEWTPKNQAYSASIASANFYQLAQLGWFDNKTVRVWTCYMPTPGDAFTYGCSPLFGGRISDCTVERGKITFQVNSFLDVVNQYVPLNTIELLSTPAAYNGASPPKGFSDIPQFDTVTGVSPTLINGDCSNIGPHHVFDTNALRDGYIVFNDGAGATLAGQWAAIQQNTRVTIAGTDYNQFILFQALPWPPKPGVDTFYVSATPPINLEDGDYVGFPYVPSPESAV